MLLVESVFVLMFLIRGLITQEILEGCEYDSLKRMYQCNEIYHIFPNQYYGKYHLKCIHCNISKFTEKTFPFINKLESFNVSHSGIRIITKGAFSKLNSTQFIYLNHNEVKDIAEDAFFGATQMFELHLEYNSLKKIRQGFLNGAGSNSVDLSFNRIEEITDGSFVGSLGILVLDFSNNRITKMYKNSFNGLHHLEILDLQNNKICFLTMGVFSMLSKLKKLNLSNNKLSTFVLGTFSGLSSLDELNVSSNSLEQFDGDVLLSLPNLYSLDISNNGIHNLQPSTITLLSFSLRKIRLDQNIFSCTSLKQFVLRLTRAKIKIISYNGIYDVQNIFGLVCTEVELKKNISYKKFLELAEEETFKKQKFC